MRENNCCLSLNIKLRTNGHNNSQHCWPNNVGSCCVCLNAAKSLTCFKLSATTRSHMQQGVQTEATWTSNNIGSCWPTMLRPFSTLGREGSGYKLRECPFPKKAVSFLEALCSWPTELENSLSYLWGKVVSVDTGSEKHEFCFRRKQACTQKARVKSRAYENWLKNPIGKPLQVMVSWESGLP